MGCIASHRPVTTRVESMPDQSRLFEPVQVTRNPTTAPDYSFIEPNTNGNDASPLPSDTSLPLEISEEFADLCVQMRTAARPDVLVALRQMQSLLEVLPFSVIWDDPTFLTLRSLLEIAIETQPIPARLRCFAFGVTYLQSVSSSPSSTTDSESREGQKKPERFSEAQSELLTYFLLEPRRPRTNEQIAEALWPAKDSLRAQQSFHTARQRLHQFAGEEVILIIKRGQYLLNPNLPIWFDVAEFETLCIRAQSARNPQLRVKMLENAVDLYRGDFLEKNYKDWSAPIRTRLRMKYLAALLQLGQSYEKENAAQAIDCYDKILRADPLSEDAYFHLIALHTARGDRIAAQRTWLLCWENFKQDLGIEPSSAFIERVQPYMAEMGSLISAA